jgi:hypothetical protein
MSDDFEMFKINPYTPQFSGGIPKQISWRDLGLL